MENVTRSRKNLDAKFAFMREAVLLSQKGMRGGKGGPFGAVIVREGVIIARGFNQVTSSNDPTAHAEVVAIRKACRKLKSFQLDGCELYTSCEPCPMCLGAIYWARPLRVYYANTREDAAAIGFDDKFIYDELPKSLDCRTIPMERIIIPEARGPFEEWSRNQDKTRY